MDSSVSPEQASDTRTSDIELPVDIDSISIDNTQPEVGDQVDVTVRASVTRLVNGIAWLKPDQINHQPIPDTPLERNDDLSELDRAYNMSLQTRESGGAGNY